MALKSLKDFGGAAWGSLLGGRPGWLRTQAESGLAPRSVVNRLTMPPKPTGPTSGTPIPALSPGALRPLSRASEFGSHVGDWARGLGGTIASSGIGAGIGYLGGGGEHGTLTGATGGAAAGGLITGMSRLRRRNASGAGYGPLGYNDKLLDTASRMGENQPATNRILATHPDVTDNQKLVYRPGPAESGVDSTVADKLRAMARGGGPLPDAAYDPRRGADALRAEESDPQKFDDIVKQNLQATRRDPNTTPWRYGADEPPRQSFYRDDQAGDVLKSTMAPAGKTDASLAGSAARILGGGVMGGLVAPAVNVVQGGLSRSQAATSILPALRDGNTDLAVANYAKAQGITPNQAKQELESALAGLVTKNSDVIFGALSKMSPDELKNAASTLEKMPEPKKRAIATTIRGAWAKMPDQDKQKWLGVAKSLGLDPEKIAMEGVEKLFQGYDIGGWLAGHLGFGDQWKALPFQSRVAYTAAGLTGLVSLFGLLVGSQTTALTGLGMAGLAGGYGYGQSQGWFDQLLNAQKPPAPAAGGAPGG